MRKSRSSRRRSTPDGPRGPGPRDPPERVTTGDIVRQALALWPALATGQLIAVWLLGDSAPTPREIALHVAVAGFLALLTAFERYRRLPEGRPGRDRGFARYQRIDDE